MYGTPTSRPAKSTQPAHSAHSTRRWIRYSPSLLLIALLSACGGGGGDDDNGPPVAHNGPSSECDPTAFIKGTVNYQYASADWRAEKRDTDSFNEPVQLNGRSLLRIRTQTVYAYSAPANVAGRQFFEVRDTYYQRNADGSRTVYSEATARRWETETAPSETYAFVYDPPFLDRRFALKPGQSTDDVVKGFKQVMVKGQTTTTPISGTNHITYHGQEVMPVPGGSLVTCKFTSQHYDGAKETLWNTKDMGFYIKSQATYADGSTATEDMTSYSGYR